MAVKYQFEIEGISDMKQDNPVTMEMEQPKNPEGYIKQAEMKVYKDSKGNIAVPAAALKAAMKLASSEIGKKMEAKKNRQTIQSAVFIEPEMLSLGKKKHDGIDKSLVTRAGQGGKVTRVFSYRPLIKNGWKAVGTITAFQNAPKEFIQASMELAGQRFGLLSHRPDFGRFQVNKFVQIK
jgi:hypothetical protein